MSDIPPPLEDQGPCEPDHPPPVRSRGIRGGKAAKRKRTTCIRWVLQASPDLSVDQVAVIHQDKTQRPLYTRAGWTPDSLDEDDEEKTASGTFRPPEPVGPPPAFRPPEPAGPPPTSSFAPLEPEGTLPSEPSSSSTAFVAPQKASSQVIIPTAKAAPPTFSRLNRTPPAPPTSRQTEPQPPALQVNSARPGPPVKAAPKAAREEGEISSADLGGGALIFNPLTNGKVKLADSDRLRVKRAVFFDFHNTIDRYFVPGRRKPSAIPWPNDKPVLIPEIMSVIKRISEAATEDTENLTCVSVLSHINNSVANESWLPDTIYDTVEELGEVTNTGRVLFDIIVVIRQKDGPHGKLQVAEKILDDNINVATEFIRGGHQRFHIRLPKRAASLLGRSYSNILEAEQAVVEWIRCPL